uniref:(northern house mosquito) hypothetical protein n=1 Tax=Culex pipiens TaxID=7175 RepID=A0A8D8AJ22_CULPI
MLTKFFVFFFTVCLLLTKLKPSIINYGLRRFLKNYQQDLFLGTIGSLLLNQNEMVKKGLKKLECYSAKTTGMGKMRYTTERNNSKLQPTRANDNICDMQTKNPIPYNNKVNNSK